MSNITAIKNKFVYKCNLGITLHLSQRMYKARIKNKWIIYAPDTAGLPILISNDTYQLLQCFINGQKIGHVISTLGRLDIKVDKLIEMISFLEEKGFLKTEKTPARYSAYDTHNSDPTSFGIWLHINNQCNLECSYCFVNKFDKTMDKPVTDETIFNIVHTIRSRSIKKVILKFAGGEPTLSMPLVERFHTQLLIALADVDVELHTSILSNGTIITDQLISFLKKPNCEIGISLDGYGSDYHDIYRKYKGTKKGSWNKIIENISILADHGIKPYIMSTISEATCESLPDLVNWIFKNKLRTRLSIVRQPSEKVFEREKNTCLIQNKETKKDNQLHEIPSPDVKYENLLNVMIDAFEKAFTELENNTHSINLVNSLSICELHFNKPSYTACCGIGSTHVVIQEDGYLASCPMTLKESNIPVKNNDLLATIKHSYSINAHTRNDLKNPCLECQWFPVCVGGCPVNNERQLGSPLNISPLHRFYQYVIPRYITFYGTKLYQASIKLKINHMHIIEG